MSLTINTNLSALIAHNSLKTSTNKLNQAIERMTTGYKINHAKDNAANYAIATQLSTKIGAYSVAEENAMMGLDMVQTASSSLDLMSDLASRLRALATQAQNGTYGTNSLTALNSEAQSIVQEMNRIKSTTNYNGIKLLGDSAQTANTSVISTYDEEGIGPTSGLISRRDTSGMTKLADVDENTLLYDGTYSISTSQELAKLATMTNNGLIDGAEFVLANDIDLSAYSTGEGWTPIGDSYDNDFRGDFDGNGYVISNLYINRPNGLFQGLFGIIASAKIKNLGLENVNVTGKEGVGGLVGQCFGEKYFINNCYVTGSVTDNSGAVSGLSSQLFADNVENSYYMGANGQITVFISGNEQLITKTELDEYIARGVLLAYRGYSGSNSEPNSPSLPSLSKKNFSLGISISSSSTSQIDFELKDADISILDGLDLTDANALSTIDEVIKSINEQQTTLGAVENRLTSALEQIHVAYDNLVSTQSTILDADIAEESSNYIKMQILQQASATLMATANQSPSIALQLL